MTGHTLWGMDGSYRGNEKRVHLTLPALFLDGRVWLAREADWSPENPHTGQWLEVARAEKVLSPFPELGLTVRAGERVVVVGLKYHAALLLTGLWEAFLGHCACAAHPNGFWMGTLSKQVFVDHMMPSLMASADTVYNAELRAGHKTPSELADAAFLVWGGSNISNVGQFVVRRTAHAIWSGDEGLAGRFLDTGRILWKLDPVKCRKRAEDRLLDAASDLESE